MSAESNEPILNILHENRSFPPPQDFQKNAHVRSFKDYQQRYKNSMENTDGFWRDVAHNFLDWQQDFSKVLDWQPPHAKWFVGGRLNATYNCLDRHVANGKGHKTALIWQGESGPHDIQRLSYDELLVKVSKCANVLKELGVIEGDRVTIYMPLIPELTVAVLACARIGAVHSVVFGGFSAEALSSRNNDAQSKLLITVDQGVRKGQRIDFLKNVEDALEHSQTIRQVLIKRRSAAKISTKSEKFVDWDRIMSQASENCPPVWLDSEHPLFILYTSGSTGKPKGIMHTTAGYLVGAACTFHYVFDFKEDDIYWCTADVGWITGHSYVIYGPLLNAATVVMYEGAPNHPTPSRFWEIIEAHKVSIFYTAPTAIRSFIKWGDEHVESHDLSSLRLLGTVGEPINPEAWMWFREKIGGGRCPIVDTWWQTETGCIMIAPLPGATDTYPGTATRPFFGIDADVVDERGVSVGANQGGYLVIKKPWPSMLRTIYGDDQRYKDQYWSQIPGIYFTGDGARKDAHGNFWIMGRIDDVLNVSGHRLSTMEIESALVSHPSVAEAAVVGRPDAIKGEGIVCFVSLENTQVGSIALKAELIAHVIKQIGALARPDEIQFAETLPKTRSGKIMRRLLRDIASGRATQGDITTLEDVSVLERLRSPDANS